MGFDSVFGCVNAPNSMAYMVYELRKSYPAYLVTYQHAPDVPPVVPTPP